MQSSHVKTHFAFGECKAASENLVCYAVFCFKHFSFHSCLLHNGHVENEKDLIKYLQLFGLQVSVSTT